MLQNRLYYQDPYRTSFTTTVTQHAIDEQGRPFAVLENTAFYPTGGGQPHDIGYIADIAVVDVEEVDGEIRHYLESPLSTGGTISAEIDWSRRFDHMQQHTGQHILTAAFVELFNYPTVSFHLGRELVTIDLATEHVSADELHAAETLANAIILENRPIEQKWVTQEELSAYSLRKQVSVDEEIRLVIIPDFDTNGCGGTHPSSTGQIGSLKILSTEKQKKNTRVHFVCGGRVLDQLGAVHDELSVVARLLSAPLGQAAEATQKLLETQHLLEKQLEAANEQLLDVEAASLAARKTIVIRQIYTNRSMQELQKLSRKTLALCEKAIVVLVSDDGEKLQFVVSRTNSLVQDMRTVSSIALPAIEGKGGGSASTVQGGGARTMPAEDLSELLERSIPIHA
ncbi:alanyl-tRNA editing protein [Sporosarcina gallistercoris]|uniref:Alanyl-tRNA editing protein n=1 Tax=Sporosarcina gallistercoris TaxID=2762245 RepID=A0ABR8PKW3_9BACL|nr:DHHA1 domain-containing protein [Sporosarcina gallistercoris]MBD7908789.1 alanyl-tRNA editing protein [Sporosarcina gallistercoris]